MTTPGPDERLSAYFDGELSAAERAEVERLLAERSDLRNELNGMADLSLRLNDLAEDLPDFDLRSHVMAQIESKHRSTLSAPSRPSSSVRPSWMPMFLSVCSLVLLAAVIWPLLPMSDNMPQLAQHGDTEKALAAPMVAIMNAPVVSQESEPAPSELGILTTNNNNNSVVDTSDAHGNLTDTANQLVSPDGKGPSVLLAQIEKSRGLKAGEIVGRMIESGDTPVLAEYTVVDVRRTAQDVEVLLMENGIQPVVPPQSETKDAAQSSIAKVDAESPLRVYLVDAESAALNNAFLECKALQEVVATNVDSFSDSPHAEANIAGTMFRSYPNDIQPPTSEMIPETSPYSSSVPAPLDPESPAAKLQLMRNKQDARAAKEQRKSRLPPGAPPTATDKKSNSGSSMALTKSAPLVIAGNSLAVENSVEVYTELQHLMYQPKVAAHSSDRAQIVPPEPNPPGVVESQVRDELNAVSRPESQKMSTNFRSNRSLPQKQQQQQANRNRQRAFLVLRSQPSAQPPVPPQAVPLQPPY